MVAVAEDVPRLRDGLGIPVPPGVAASFAEPAPRPDRGSGAALGADPRAVRRRRRSPRRYGLGRAVVEAACDALVASRHPGRRVVRRPAAARPAAELAAQYCHGQVLALIKRRTLAALRKEVEPVEQVAYARFLAEWQGVGSGGRGQLMPCWPRSSSCPGYAMPASAVESVILPARVRGLPPGDAGRADHRRRGRAGWATGAIGESRRLGPLLSRGSGAAPGPGRARAYRRPGTARPPWAGAARYFFDALLPTGRRPDRPAEYVAALWDLVWAGLGHRRHVRPGPSSTAGGAHQQAAPGPARAHATGPAGRPARLPGPDAPRSAHRTTAGRWSLVDRGAIAADRAAGRRRLRPARPLRRGHPRQRADRERRRAASARPTGR